MRYVTRFVVKIVIAIVLVGLSAVCWADEAPQILLRGKENVQSNTHLIVDGTSLTVECHVVHEWGHEPSYYEWKLDGKVIGSGKIYPITVPSPGATQKDFHISCSRSGTSVEAVLTVEGISPDNYLRYLLSGSSVSEVEKILATDNTLVNAADKYYNTPLHLACTYKRLDMVKCLIKHGAKLDAKDDGLATPLNVASSDDSTEIALALLSAGASVSVIDSRGFSPLHYAAKNGNVTLVKALINAKAPVNAQNYEWATPLHLAVSNRMTIDQQREIVSALLQAGANETLIENTNGLTPLHMALVSNVPEDVIRLLIANTVNFQAKNFHGNGYLHYAVVGNNQNEIITELIDHGCSPTEGDNKGITPMHIAASYSKQSLEYFLNHGVDIEITDNNLETPLFYAVEAGKDEVVKFLIMKGAKQSIKSRNRESLLFYAVRSGSVDLVKYFTEKGCDINEKDSNGDSPLQFSVRYNQLDAASYLLMQPKIDVDIKDSTGWTPLFFAVKFGYNKMANILITYHADVNIKDKDGISILKVAEEVQNEEMVNLLRQNGAEE